MFSVESKNSKVFEKLIGSPSPTKGIFLKKNAIIFQKNIDNEDLKVSERLIESSSPKGDMLDTLENEITISVDEKNIDNENLIKRSFNNFVQDLKKDNNKTVTIEIAPKLTEEDEKDEEEDEEEDDQSPIFFTIFFPSFSDEEDIFDFEDENSENPDNFDLTIDIQ